MTQELNPSTIRMSASETQAANEIHEYLRPYRESPDAVLLTFVQAFLQARGPYEGVPLSTGLQAALQTHSYALSGLVVLLSEDDSASWLTIMHARTWTQRKFLSMARDVNRLEVTSLQHALSRPERLTPWAEQMAAAGQATEAGELGVWGILNHLLERLPHVESGEVWDLLGTLFEALTPETVPNPPPFPVPEIAFPWTSEEMDSCIPLVTEVKALGLGQAQLITPERSYQVGPEDYEFPPFGAFTAEERFISVMFGEELPMLLRIRLEDAQELADFLDQPMASLDADSWIN